jgi:hypothetical protein
MVPLLMVSCGGRSLLDCPCFSPLSDFLAMATLKVCSHCEIFLSLVFSSHVFVSIVVVVAVCLVLAFGLPKHV